ncbi:MAG: homocysteine S-methyltransferase family protein [Actinomycetota bacterium]|nr:homocysteine S-methyltransferase family protein [Actinomycetota bacterium]
MNTTTRTPWPVKGTTVVTDAGLETWLLFQRGVELPAFAAYPLAATETGRALLTEYLQHYAAIASSVGAAPALDAATWRANPDWADALGHDLDTLGSLIDACIGVVADVRTSWQGNQPFLINGPVGPRGDGYRVEDSMTPEAAADYHGFQVSRMADAGVDVVTALTMGYVGEAAGIALAARAAGLPAVVSFTLETDGRLPTGMPLGEAIEATDAATGAYPLHYMINCAHPTHFDHVLDRAAPWAQRIGGIRANASSLSHAELDEMVELDEGDPDDLARRYVALRDQLPSLQVVGGCCGTDHRHVAAIATAWQR